MLAEFPAVLEYLRGSWADLPSEVEQDLRRWAERVIRECEPLAVRAEAQMPRHIPYSPWGERIDEIEVSSAWAKLHEISAEEGLVALGFERKYAAHSRLYQFLKLMLFHPSSAFVTCPLAMTDGAARALELYGTPELKEGAFRYLTSRDPAKFWTSGQWMTEKEGGSDVSRSSTRAEKDGETWVLRGDKWFTSATTSQMILTLAQTSEGGKEGLALYYAELRDTKGRLKNIRINRLKDKLGTKALPTAELSLEGTPAVALSEPGGGVKRIAAMLNITRLYNSITAVGTMLRSVQLAKDYAERREAFGKLLKNHPLHMRTLSQLEAEATASMIFTLDIVQCLGREETKRASEEDLKLLRTLTPVVKLMTGKSAVRIASESIECIGGAGYIEDTGMPKLLRDSQVFPIWEGTTNILSLDMLRAFNREKSLPTILGVIGTRLSAGKGATALLKAQFEDLKTAVGQVNSEAAWVELARDAAFALGSVYAGAAWYEASSRNPGLKTELLGIYVSETIIPAVSKFQRGLSQLGKG